jgi:glycosyltransferase involved in cell wall biosynthesis
VFALPSLHEGMPIVLLEALALERPVVAMRVGGIPEVVEDGRTGLLVAPGDAAALAQRCLALVEKPDDARRLAQAGARDVRERFSVDRTAAEVADVYRALMQPAPSVRRDAALVVAERSR